MVKQADCNLGCLMLSLFHAIGMAQTVPVLKPVLAPILGGGDVFFGRDTKVPQSKGLPELLPFCVDLFSHCFRGFGVVYIHQGH
jgi:hypothetical protein